MTTHDLIQMALRTIIVYLYLVVILRLVGKRTFGNFGPLELVLALVLGQIVAAPLLGELPLLPAFALIALLALAHWLNGYLAYRSSRLDHLLRGSARTLIRHGQLNRRVLAAEMISLEELAQMLREHEVEMVSEVKLATLERDGTLTVLKTDAARELQKGDLDALLQLETDEQAWEQSS